MYMRDREEVCLKRFIVDQTFDKRDLGRKSQMELTKKEAEELAKKIRENSKKHSIPLKPKKAKKAK